MLLPFLLMVALLSLSMLVVWICSKQPPEAGDQAGGPTKGRPAAGLTPESLEGVLVAQLNSAHISRRQYVLAMERAAARDEQRRPLSVPPDAGPASA